MKTQRRIFFDFDLTLYDTEAFMADITRRLLTLGCSRESINAGFTALNDTGYSFEAHLHLLGLPEHVIQRESAVLSGLLTRGSRYLLPGVCRGLYKLRRRGYECSLLTFGFPPFQRQKWEGVPVLHKHFIETHFVWREKTKGDVLSDYHWLPFVFCDDSPQHLLDARRKIKGAVCLTRFMWPRFNQQPHPEDGKKWQVIRSFDEFVSYFA